MGRLVVKEFFSEVGKHFLHRLIVTPSFALPKQEPMFGRDVPERFQHLQGHKVFFENQDMGQSFVQVWVVANHTHMTEVRLHGFRLDVSSNGLASPHSFADFWKQPTSLLTLCQAHARLVQIYSDNFLGFVQSGMLKITETPQCLCL